MKQTLRAFALLLSMISFLGVQARDIYGYMTGNGNLEKVPTGLYKFDTDSIVLDLQANMTIQFWGGAHAQNLYYFAYSSDYQGYIYEGLHSFDFKDNQMENVDQSQPYQCSDMTYDYSTQTLLGMQIQNAGEPVNPTLIAIDTQTGAKKSIANVNKKIAAIACNYWGDLFAMGYDNHLYLLDKTNGDLTLIGKTGIMTDNTQAQSMEFDRNTGELYWTFLDSEQSARIVKLDPYAKDIVVKNQIMPENALIVGLHIPVDITTATAPAKVNTFAISNNGQNNVLSWNNPTLSYEGKELKQISKIEILRNNTLVHSIDNPIPGEKMTWTDNHLDSIVGNVRYVVYAYNENGRGEGASEKCFIGDDVPGLVTDFKIEVNGNAAQLSWNAPEKGENGGKITSEDLCYRIIRMPDHVTFSDVKSNFFKDETIQLPARYSYEISCYNTTGEGNKVTSDTLLIGLAIIPPFKTDFSSDLLAAQWEVIDANQDKVTWKWKNNAFVYSFSFSNAGDDHLVSVPFKLEKGKEYVAKYTISAPNMFSEPEHFELKVGEKIIEKLDRFNNQTAEERAVPFTVEEDGEYQFTLSSFSPANNWQIEISQFSVDVSVPYDIAILDVMNNEDLIANVTDTLTVQVYNNGTSAISQYTLDMTDQNGKILVSKTFEEEIVSGDTLLKQISWLPSNGVTDINITAKTNGDKYSSNNIINKKVFVIPADEHFVEAGGTDSHPYLFPFAFNGKEYSYTQTIYRKEELNQNTGEIHGISYMYDNPGEDLVGKHIKLYMCNTDNPDVTTGWMLEEDMTLVFDGYVTFERGQHAIRFTFDQPFRYTGEHLMIMNQKLEDSSLSYIRFYAKNYVDEVRTAIFNGSTAEINFSEVQGSSMLNQIKIRMKDTTTGIASSNANTENILWSVQDGNLHLSKTAEYIKIYDMTGRVISKGLHTDQIVLPHHDLGVCILEINNDGIQTVQKLLLNR